MFADAGAPLVIGGMTDAVQRADLLRRTPRRARPQRGRHHLAARPARRRGPVMVWLASDPDVVDGDGEPGTPADPATSARKAGKKLRPGPDDDPGVHRPHPAIADPRARLQPRRRRRRRSRPDHVHPAARPGHAARSTARRRRRRRLPLAALSDDPLAPSACIDPADPNITLTYTITGARHVHRQRRSRCPSSGPKVTATTAPPSRPARPSETHPRRRAAATVGRPARQIVVRAATAVPHRPDQHVDRSCSKRSPTASSRSAASTRCPASKPSPSMPAPGTAPRNAELMSSCRPEKPSRYRMRLQVDERADLRPDVFRHQRPPLHRPRRVDAAHRPRHRRVGRPTVRSTPWV